MKVRQLYSSSKANLYLVTAENGHRVLIECGVEWPKLVEAIDYKTDIDFCLLTHRHLDHSIGAKSVMENGIKLYCSPQTAEALQLSGRHLETVENKTLIRQTHFDVLTFATKHDCEGPLGYIIREKATNEYLLFATDTSVITGRFNIAFSIIMLECSYNGEYLAKKVREGTIKESLAKRLLTSHMEETECLRYLQEFCNLSHCRVIHLLHCSADHINKKRIRKEFEKELFIKVVTI